MATDGTYKRKRLVIMAIVAVIVAVMAALLWRMNRSTGLVVAGSPTVMSVTMASVSPTAPVAPVKSVDVVSPEFATVKMLPADANPAVAAVAQALKTNDHPEYTTPLAHVPAFDPAAYAQDPAAYCAPSVPARVFQTAAPGPGVPALAPVSPMSSSLSVGGSVGLSAKTAPGAPVTFVTFDLGGFPNGLTAITVPADGEGVAKTTYTATPGTLGHVLVLAGSPMASGQVQFQLAVYGNDVPRIPDRP